MWGEKIAFSCLQLVNKTQLFSSNFTQPPFGAALYSTGRASYLSKTMSPTSPAELLYFRQNEITGDVMGGKITSTSQEKFVGSCGTVQNAIYAWKIIESIREPVTVFKG